MKQAVGYRALPPEGNQGVLRIQAPDGSEWPAMPGRVLEAVYADETDALVFVTHDILHEEQLDIFLLRAGRLLDQISLGQMFQPAEFGNLIQIDARRFGFTFPADVSWDLKVSHSARFTLPDWRGSISRLRAWQSYFTLTRSYP